MNNRLSKFKKLLSEKTLDAALISSVPDILYLTGFSHFSDIEREGFLLITKDNNYIITDGRYSHAVKTHIKNFQLLELSGQTNFEKILEKIFTHEKIKNLGIDEFNLSVYEHKKIKNVNTKHFNLTSLRRIKDPSEIEKIQKACTIGDKTFTYILTKIKKGITEKQIALELENFIKQQEAEFSFPAIVAFQENAAIPHHKTGNRTLNDNEFILLDFGVKYDNYCSDMTRTIFFGKANEEQKKTYQTVLEAQLKTIEQCNFLIIKQLNNETMKQSNININASDLDNAARSYIISKGYLSIPHSLGHGIGLEVHESPSLSPKSKDELTRGMVFSIEPGIYLNDKFGIRVEDLFAIQNNKLIQLTKSTQNFIEI